ncbi:electron transport complex protein RnfA [Miniphocaeibacter halophilus]|uniref:RnfABCDGE type electron transport complex subunit A n=1 Tax=Miniphocaeibacter halophilus TaxID=2931922 RepID=A0AC61MNP5_9FIRM|nr:RnfABCDGE type electron transport complex subunit A [Miniphocaeibacter halophilus]QQK07145.1 RnfABCDGE type electron transport complex subunit A [Miniphocaeibacter halophilus]
MELLSSIFKILVLYIFVNNYVLGQFLGICPLIGVSTKTETAAGMGLAVTFVITMASIVTYFIQYFLLERFNLQYTQTIVFILVIATLVQFVEMVLKKMTPGLYSALGVFLPLITTNCVVLGVAIANIQEGYNLIETVASALGSSIGFFIAIVLLSAIREKLELADVPKAFKGVPIALVAIGLMAMAFLGFSGLV